jgi:hypothetical protein
LPQEWEFTAEFVEHCDEALCRRSVSDADLSRSPKDLDDQIDRSIVEVQPAGVRQKSYLGSLSH